MRLDDDVGLLDAEDVGARVVGAQQVDAVVRLIPVVLVEAFEADAEDDVLKGDSGRRWPVGHGGAGILGRRLRAATLAERPHRQRIAGA